MRWQPWSAEAFSESAATGRPILLFLTTGWSRGCAHMERETFADARVRERVARGFIPMRVDADERPDIAERYGLDAWPSTLLLTAGGEILQGGTYLDADTLVTLLDRTLRAWREAPGEVARRSAALKTRPAPPAPENARPAVEPTTLRDRIAASLAFPGAARFLHGDAIVFLLRHGTPVSVSSALAILDAADASPLCRADGAVLRCTAMADWSQVVDEVTADTHASALRGFGEAVRCGADRHRDRLERIAAFVRRTWVRPASPPGASVPQAPPSMTTDAAAELAEACLGAAAALDDPGFSVDALAWLEGVALATYRPGSGVRHRADPAAPGFASDHIALVSALLAAHDLTEQMPYAMLAEELGHSLCRTFFDEEAGALRDRVHLPDDVARLGEPAYPFRWNARAAGALSRLSRTAGQPRFDEVSSRLLRWSAARWAEHGLDAAALGLYWRNP